MQEIPSRINSKRPTPRYNKQTVKNQRESRKVKKQQLVTYEGSSIGVIGNLLSETMEARRHERTYLKFWKKNLLTQEFFTWQNYPLEMVEM